jgi:hypothetical protein
MRFSGTHTRHATNIGNLAMPRVREWKDSAPFRVCNSPGDLNQLCSVESVFFLVLMDDVVDVASCWRAQRLHE